MSLCQFYNNINILTPFNPKETLKLSQYIGIKFFNLFYSNEHYTTLFINIKFRITREYFASIYQVTIVQI